jgi:hypothetical protein
LIKKASKEDFKAFWDDWWLGPGRDQYGWVNSPYDIREEKGIEEMMFNVTGKMPTVNQAGPIMIGEAGPLLMMMYVAICSGKDKFKLREVRRDGRVMRKSIFKKILYCRLSQTDL